MHNISSIKERYRILERNVLILIILPLPFFAFVYLNLTKPIRTIEIPEVPELLNPFLFSLAVALLAFQQINFKRNINSIKEKELGLEDKLKGYSKATTLRYVLLAVVGFIAAAGLLFYENAGFTVTYAITLILVSVAKPSPERINRLFGLKGEEKELVYHINKF